MTLHTEAEMLLEEEHAVTVALRDLIHGRQKLSAKDIISKTYLIQCHEPLCH